MISFFGHLVTLAEEYPIAKWMNDPSVDRELSFAFKRLVDVGEEYNYKDFNDCSFVCCDHGEGKGFAIAYTLNFICISFETDETWKNDKIEGTVRHFDATTSQVTIPNISNKSNLEVNSVYFKRIFEPYKKHLPRCGWGTTLDITDEEAQKLLDTALPLNTISGSLVNIDRSGRYIVFHKHKDNRYHAFPKDENEIPEVIKRKLKT